MNSEGLYERGLMMMQRKKEIFETNNEEKARKELEDVFDFPEINYRSRVIIGDRDPLFFHEYSQRWLDDKNKKIEESRRATIEKERSFSPVRRASTPRGYQSIVTDWENRVAQYYEKKNTHSDFYSHTPEINSVSRAMLPVWNEPVEERLTRIHAEKQARLEEMRQKQNAEVPTFAPITNESTKARPDDISNFLYQDGMQMLEKKKQAAEMCQAGLFSFKPIINENSRVLAANRKPPKPKVQAISEAPPSRILKADEFEFFLQRNYTRPLSKKEVRLAEDEVPEETPKKKIWNRAGESLYEKEIRRISKKEEKRLEILRARVESELDGCTFKPKVITRNRTPPPMPINNKENTLKQRYCKSPSTNREFLRYEDSHGKAIQLKAFYHIDKSLFLSLEEYEKKVIHALKQ